MKRLLNLKFNKTKRDNSVEEKKKIRWSKEKILELFEQNEIKNTSELQKIAPGAAIYSWRHGIMDELPFTDRKVVKTNKSNSLTLKPALVEHFKNWAAAEGTDVECQAKKYSFHKQYVEYCELNELDLKTAEKIENIKIKIKNI